MTVGIIEVAQEGTVVIRVGSIICLEGTGSLRTKEAGVVINRSSALKAAFLASSVVMLVFTATSLLLIPRRFLIKSATSTSKAASRALA